MRVDRSTKIIVLLNGAVPATLLGWDAWHGRLGTNPANFAILTTGLLALIFLVLSLAITPLSRITGWGWFGQFRRMLGLYAFFHALLHFFLYFWFDRAANVRDTASEIGTRPYLMVGMIGLLLMVPLAATSTDGMIKRLGAKRWKALHRLAYPAAIAGALHYYMQAKSDTRQPIAFAAVLGVLLLYRIVAHYLQLRSDARNYRNAPPAPPASRPKTWAGQLKVAQVFDETPEVRTFRLVSTDGPRLPFDYLPGQYLNLMLMIEGQKVRRSYTIASSPSRVAYCELTVKREDRGLSSRYLHGSIREGSLLDVRAPAGRFTFSGTEAEGLVMIAGGVGITPLMAKIRYLTDLSWPGTMDLLFSVKAEPDIIFRDELQALAHRHPNLHVTITLTRDDPEGWSGERGRIDPAMLKRFVPDIAHRSVHICGPTEMTEPTRRMLLELGVADDAIQTESFASPSRVASTDLAAAKETLEPSDDASITFAVSGKTAPMMKNQTVLEAAESLGVAIDYDCRSAICGRCKVKLLEGRVVMDAEDALTPSDRANDLILSCQARCVDQVTVEA